MQRIDHQRVVWIQHGEERRRYAVPMNYNAALVARDAFISFTSVRGKHGDFPKNKVFVLRELSDGREIPSRTSARDLGEGRTYSLTIEDES